MRWIAVLYAVVGLHASLIRADDLGLKVPVGFRVTQFADHLLVNDLFAMTLDEKGHVVVTSRGWIKVLEDTDGDGKADRATTLAETKSGAMGMWVDGSGIYLMADGTVSRVSRSGNKTPVRESLVPLRFGEHGGHAIRKGPDGYWYVIGGNDADIAKVSVQASSPIQKPEGGGILRFSADWKHGEIIAQGFRNPYDFDFTPTGDIITYDSDTERDFLLPWYSPTRVYHVGYGMHHGWRLPGFMRSLARRPYYPDTVDILAPIGRGSPTGVVCYRHQAFPKKYQGGVFALDWTFGKVWFLSLTPEGSSYLSKAEVFLEPEAGNGFAPTDACVAPDGSLLISIGGRGTRGGVYRIEYIGTTTEPRGDPVTPRSDLERLLNMPQPLEAWSRAIWEPLADQLGAESIARAAVDAKRTTAMHVRAVEILTDRFGGVPLEIAKQLAVDASVLTRSRVAWSMGRKFRKEFLPLLVQLAHDDQPRVRVEALTALADNASSLGTFGKQLPAIIAENLAHVVNGKLDRRVHLAAARLMSRLPQDAGPVFLRILEKASLLTRLNAGIADFWPGSLSRLEVTWKLAVVEQGLQSKDKDIRMAAIRLIMLLGGDWCLNQPPTEVYSAYAFQNALPGSTEQHLKIRKLLLAIYPTRDVEVDHEIARLFAMFSDDQEGLVGKLLEQISATSPPTEDVHHLIILSRIHGKRSKEQTSTVANALLGLANKLQGQQLRIKQNWAARLAEMIQNITRQHPDLPEIMLAHPMFVHPAHVAFTIPWEKPQRKKAAELFQIAVKRDIEFPWSVELVDLLTELPPAEYRPLFRRHWSDFSLRDAMLKHLVLKPDLEDRQRFLDGLDSTQPAIVKQCVEALLCLPRDDRPASWVAIYRRLQGTIREKNERDLRSRLLLLLNRETGQHFSIDESKADPDALQKQLEPIYGWLLQNHPTEAKMIFGDEEDADAWKTKLAKVEWEKGDVERGMKLFRDRACLGCHAGSSRIGPDLTGVTNRFSRDDLFNAILFPSRDVAPAFRVNVIETHDGKRLSGIVVFESADGVIVQTDATTTTRVDNVQIASRQPSTKSLMPSGLLKDLEVRDFADLYRYLQSLSTPDTRP